MDKIYRYIHRDTGDYTRESRALGEQSPGLTPLCHAVMRGHREIVRLLIDKGASVDQECCYKGNGETIITAMHFAIKNEDDEMVKLLQGFSSKVDYKTPELDASLSEKLDHILAYTYSIGYFFFSQKYNKLN